VIIRQTVTTGDTELTCELADIRFHFNNLPADAFNVYFQPFLGQSGPVRNTCRIDVLGANPDLCAVTCGQAWNFTQEEGRACLTGANPAGDVLWRMTGDVPFERLSFEWHPTAFEALYRNEVYGTYGIIAILALVLRLLHLGGFVMHGSAQVVDGRAIICTGPSGKGKSTISRLFAQCGVPVLTDERPILRRFVRAPGDAFRVYGSPWPSSGGFALNASAPLRKVYFLEHGPEHAVEPLTRREAVLRLLDVSLVPWLDAAFFDPVIRTLETMLDAVPHAVLRFRPEASVVEWVKRDLDTLGA
jgi:hypothetical protein